MNDPRRGAEASEIGNGNLLTLARSGWPILLLGLVIGGLVAFIVAKQLAPTYEASISLLTGPINADFDTQRADGNLARTYAGLATSGPVLRRTARATKTELTVDELRDDVRATSNDVTRIITIRVQNSDAARAARLANAVGAQLVKFGRNRSDERLDAFMADPAVAQLPAANQDRLRAAAAKAFAETSTGRLTTVDPAEAPTDPVAPRVGLLALLGALAGLVVGGLVVLIRDSLIGRVQAEVIAKPD